MKKQNIVVVSTSLSKTSRSKIAAAYATELLQRDNKIEVDWIDLSEHTLASYPIDEESKTVLDIQTRMEKADGLILAFPIYNWDASDQTRSFLAYSLDKKKMRNLPCLLIAGCSTKASFLVPSSVGTTLQSEINAIVIGSGILACGDDVNRETNEITESVQKRIEKNVHLLTQLSACNLVERQEA